MPAVRVIPPYEPRGFYALTAAAAIITGSVISPLRIHWFVAPFWMSTPGELTQVFLLPLLFSAILVFCCHRRCPVFLASALFGFSYWLTSIVTDDLVIPWTGGAQILHGAWVAFLIVSLTVGLITGLAALALRWALRRFAFTLVEQTGRLCPRCAYPIDPAAQPVCPECGSPATGMLRRRRFGRAGRALGRPLLIAVFLLFLAATTVIITRRGYPIYRFQSALDTFGETPVEMITRPPLTLRPNERPYRPAAGAWIPFPDDPVNGVIAAYLPTDEPGLPAMQLCTAARPSADTYSTVSPPVICSLNRAQADLVIKHGIPPDLLKAMQAAAPPTRDGLVIDPAPYFPK